MQRDSGAGPRGESLFVAMSENSRTIAILVIVYYFAIMISMEQ
ncbi:unnamed protein product [Amoebophrya sp. A25]|nr:unnamed protein product [Amoebophrya sp. A25]|eukprot:GSA25T00006067001.1